MNTSRTRKQAPMIRHFIVLVAVLTLAACAPLTTQDVACQSFTSQIQSGYAPDGEPRWQLCHPNQTQGCASMFCASITADGSTGPVGMCTQACATDADCTFTGEASGVCVGGACTHRCDPTVTDSHGHSSCPDVAYCGERDGRYVCLTPSSCQ